jgi:phospholipid/cholesterol/gamma-HCH transport system substrate-binding protein
VRDYFSTMCILRETEMFDTKKQLRWAKMKVGLVITISFLVLLIAVFFAGNIQNILSRKIMLKIQFKDVEGLRKGAPVWILGIEEGLVKDISLDPMYGVITTIAVNEGALRFIKKDSKATILTMGLLGDKYIELTTGSPGAGPIHPGEILRGTTEIRLRSVVEASTTTIETMNGFIKKMDRLISQIELGKGTLAKFLEDPALYDNLKETTHNLFILSEDIKNSRGTLKLLIEDPSVYNKILATVSKIEEFSRKLTEGQGTLKKLIEDPELYENFNKDLKELSSILERIEKGEGVAGALVRNQELLREFEETVTDLKKLINDIREHPKKYFKFSLF